MSEFFDHTNPKYGLKRMTAQDKPREWWIRPPHKTLPFGACADQPTIGGVHVIDYAAYELISKSREHWRLECMKMEGELLQLRAEFRELLEWKRQEIAVMKPIFDFEHPEMKLGASRIETIMRMVRERDELRAKLEEANQRTSDYAALLKAHNISMFA